MAIEPKRIVKQLPPYPRPEEGRYQKVRLDFNENTSGFPQAYPQGMEPASVSAYPEYQQLIDRIAQVWAVPAECVMLTNGSDEGLFLTAHTFIEPGEDRAVVSSPCFVVIPHCLKLAGAQVIEVPVIASNLQFDEQALEAALGQRAKVAMFATPENPTGAVLSKETVKRWCRQFPDTLFAIDEAYGEFTNQSMVDEIGNFDNLLVFKTFSKAWGMAGLRLGIVFGNARLLEFLHVVKMPYTVNSAAVWTANRLLDRRQEVTTCVKAVLEEKDRLIGELTERGYKLDAGHSNSILLHTGINAEALTNFMRDQDILVRNRSSVRFPEDLNGKRPATWGRVRVSVGTSAETNRFLDALDRFNKSYAVMFDLDGTIVDVTASYDAVVARLMERYVGKPFDMEELRALRAEGGFNDDWDAVQEMLKRRGITVEWQQIASEGLKDYMTIARDNEPLLCQLETLERLAQRHKTFIITGRTRAEFDPIWADRLNHLFEAVYCLHDVPGKRAKPAPDYLQHVLEKHEFQSGVYVGNAVDDMQAARAAGLDAIGITTTQPAAVLRAAGAHLTVPSVESLTEVFML